MSPLGFKLAGARLASARHAREAEAAGILDGLHLCARKDVDARHKAGHDERENDGSLNDFVMAGLVPAIHVFAAARSHKVKTSCPAQGGHDAS
jgi:hypothetical protein